jgi:hypothetical protein
MLHPGQLARQDFVGLHQFTNCPAITVICASRAAIPASRSATSVISSSRDISSRVGTQRSNYVHTTQVVIDTPGMSPTVIPSSRTHTPDKG